MKILNVDEAGNVIFIVYGYMNRGKHEGEVGVSAYFYNGMTNTVEELIFIPYDKSYELLKNDVDQLAYLSKSGICYLMLEGNVYAIDLESKKYTVIVSGLMEDSFKVSKSNQMLVWQEGDDKYHCTALKVLNLGTEVETQIVAGAGEYISLLGFMEEDLIYGLARQRDIKSDYTGNIIFPMHSLKIQADTGELLKTYHEKDIYIVDSNIAENQILLSRVAWNEETGDYLPASDDQIMSTEKAAVGSNSISSVVMKNMKPCWKSL